MISGSDKKIRDTRKMYHRFMVHVFVSTLLKYQKRDDLEQITIPIDSRLIKKTFNDSVSTKFLRKKKLIRFKNHSHGLPGGGRCREYWLPEKLFNFAFEIHENHLQAIRNAQLSGGRIPKNVNIFTGKYISAKKKNIKFCTNTNKKRNIPSLVKESFESLLPCPINPHAIDKYHEIFKQHYIEEKRNLEKIKARLKKKYPSLSKDKIENLPKFKLENRKLQIAAGRYYNLNSCMSAIWNRNPRRTGKFVNGQEVLEYQAKYSIQNCGRGSEVGGAFQNSAQPFKKLLLQDIPNIYNYDLKNSQAVLVYYELKACGIKNKWLKKYITNPKMRARLAKKVGISVSCWKSCFYSIIMGSGIGCYCNYDNGSKKYPAVFNNILKESANREEALEKRKNFVKEIKPLIDACKEWRENIYHSQDPRYGYNHNGFHWRNACGLKFSEYFTINDNGKTILIHDSGEIIKNESIINSVKRQLAAFFLQGREALYIHKLTILCGNNGIPVYKNEHDGLITGKKIPKRLWKNLAKELGTPSLKLEIKDICSNKKWEAFIKLYS